MLASRLRRNVDAMSLDLLGADGLDSQFVVLRIKNIDKDRLKRQIGGNAGAAAPLALALIDLAPRPALEGVAPLVAKWVRDKYGVELEYAVTDAPPERGGPTGSGFRGGVLAGVGLTGIGWVVWQFVQKLTQR